MSNFFFNGYPYPVIPVSGTVKTSGQWGDLKASAGSISMGIYDAQTYGIATGLGNGKEFFLGYSSEHTVDDLTFQMSGMKNPLKTQSFLGKDVLDFSFSNPVKPQNEVWVLGYNGAPSSKSLLFESGKAYGIMIDLEGNPIWRVFGKSLRHEIWISTEDNSSDCATGCADGVDCEKYTNQFVDKINNHVELSKLGIKARLVSSAFVLPVTTINRYQITLSDGCSDLGLAAVQASVGLGSTVKVVSKVDCTTVYEVCAATLPAAITGPQQYALSTCAACASGYTLVAAADVWLIRRPLAGTETLTSDALRDTYADTVGTAYGVAGDADKTFLGQDGSVATVRIRVPVGTAIVALLADTVEKAASEAAVCISDTVPSPVAWSDVGDSYRIQRTLTITLPRLDCAVASNRLAELTAYVAQFADYVADSIVVAPTSGGQCADDYTITQWSQGCMEPGCASIDQAMFLDFPGFDGQVWTTTPVADLPEAGKKCGIEISGGYVDTVYGNCSFDPYEYYEMEPITMQITQLTTYPFPTPKQIGAMPTALKMKKGAIGRQSGEWVQREYIKAGAYQPFAQFQSDSRIREALNSRRLEQVDRKAFYKTYYFQYKVKRTQTDQKQELMESVIYIKETEIAKQLAFESAMLAALAKFGVVLKQRDI